MTDSIVGVSGTQGVTSGGGQGGGNHTPTGGKRKQAPAEPVSDLVEISCEAREQLGGKKEKKGIFDFIGELLG